MRLELTDKNYCATVVCIDKLFTLEWCTNLVGFNVFGFTAIVSNDTKVWDIGVVFTAETQLSEAFCKQNNLFREPTFNEDQSKKGYIEANRRVRAVKLRWNKSSALFMPMESLNYLNLRGTDALFGVGESFNEIDGIEICKKYFVPTKQSAYANKTKGANKKFIRIDNVTFPEHRDTENYFRNKDKYMSWDYVTVSQKLHGSSGRFWYVKARKPLRWYEKLLKKIWVNISDTSYDRIYGSRKVIKNWNITEGENTGYYASNIRKVVLDRYKDRLPKDRIFYWEIIWRTETGSPIQKDYTYNLKQGECELYVYRIAIVNEDGVSVDLAMKQARSYCMLHDIPFVPILWMGNHSEFVVEDWLDKNYYPSYVEAVPLCKESVCDEGVCIRRDGRENYVTKAKSPLFLEKETKDLDAWIVDTESLESNIDENENNIATQGTTS